MQSRNSSWRRLPVPNGVRVGPGIGRRKGETFQLGSQTVTVTDVLGGKQLADLNGGHYVLAPLALAQNVAGRQGQLDSILITTKPGADLAQVRSAVTAAVNGRAIVADPSMRAARAGDGVKMMNYMALMGVGVALVVGAFLVYTTVTMAITQRRPVISMLRAIGGRRITIVRDMLGEAAILGVIGGAVGSGLGILMGRLAIGRLPPAITQGLEARIGTGCPVMRYRPPSWSPRSPVWWRRRWLRGRSIRFHRSRPWHLLVYPPQTVCHDGFGSSAALGPSRCSQRQSWSF